MLVLKIRIHSIVINILGSNMTTTQILHLLMLDFVYEKHQVNTEN